MRGTFVGIGTIALLTGTMAAALPPVTSLRPETRPDLRNTGMIGVPDPDAPALISRAAETPGAQAVAASLRPVARAPGAGAAVSANLPVTDLAFRDWLAGFRGRALAAGIAPGVFDLAFRGVTGPDGQVRSRDNSQAEFTRSLWDYLDSAVSAERIRNGRAALERHRASFEAIERRYRVEAEVVAAIWGLESAYGTFRGSTNIIAAMATLAHDGRRRDFFEAQLLAALRILQAGDVTPAQMTGSWAGAMGHTQFMPTSYLEHAVDFTGDGRRDIWSDDPTDALASTANYLRAFGWTHGQPWGLEVVLPQGFDYAQTGAGTKRGTGHWTRQGVRLATGGTIPDHGPSSILLPAGAGGVALVIFENFHVIERYNPADAYVIGVGHLSDRIAGGRLPPGLAPGDRPLSRAEREALQRGLAAAGFLDDKIDGIIGPNTIEAVRRFQLARGLRPDGYASAELLRLLR